MSDGLLSVFIASVFIASAVAYTPAYQPAPLTRRECLNGAAAAAAAGVMPTAALASGGATAGKTTSIPRAKVRYYGRITECMIQYETLGAAIKSEDGIKTAAASFFSDAEESPMSELTTAGYLLSVAFKIDGKIPPDKIQQVKDFKALTKSMKGLSSATKESPSKAQAAYASASTSMNVWLEGVDLPPVGAKSYDPRALPVCANPATGPCLRE